MNARAWVVGLGIALAAASSVSCGGSQAPAFPIAKNPGAMPEGQQWEGVYYNPVYGYLHLVGQSESLAGRWRRTDSSHWGELNGTVEGNLLRYTWTEHRYGGVGPSGDSKGSGVFVYKVGENDIGELDGEYAIDGSDKIGQWHCIKQVNVKPDINSINGDNPTGGAPPEQWQ